MLRDCPRPLQRMCFGSVSGSRLTILPPLTALLLPFWKSGLSSGDPGNFFDIYLQSNLLHFHWNQSNLTYLANSFPQLGLVRRKFHLYHYQSEFFSSFTAGIFPLHFCNQAKFFTHTFFVQSFFRNWLISERATSTGCSDEIFWLDVSPWLVAKLAVILRYC